MGDKPSAIKHLETFLQLSPNVKNASTIRSYIDKLRS
jgi:regulator of sirC expression with transglutaminase-like and TPR domain